jgi:oxygen-independent coproporphyrinogen-3 oxidase
MCTFCGCTKRVTKKHTLEIPYIKALLKELDQYLTMMGNRLKVQQIHLGGGTPTFFSPENLADLLDGIFSRVEVAPNPEFSFEGHPNNTTREHLTMFHERGFTRVCYGVQDYNPEVQKAINRHQSFGQVRDITALSRELGFTSVGHDVVYGLPFQTLEHVQQTIAYTLELRPDRIAFYSYAHVPWIKGSGQRGYDESNLPSPQLKRAQYDYGKQTLLDAGYVEIGMDHFALPEDGLTLAMQNGSLHRNFMGYSTAATNVMIGLGVSSIGDSWYGFAQNVKTLKEYYARLRENELPLLRGHILDQEDLIIRQHILNLMCRFETSWEDTALTFPEIPEILIKLKELEQDGLIEFGYKSLRVTERGQAFVRNICLPFDLRLQRKKPATQLFSMTV